MNFNFTHTTTTGATPGTWTFPPFTQQGATNNIQTIPTTAAPVVGSASPAHPFGVPPAAANPFGLPATVANPFTVPTTAAPVVGPAPPAHPFGVPPVTANPFGVPNTTAGPFGPFPAANQNIFNGCFPNRIPATVIAPSPAPAPIPNPFAGPTTEVQSPFGPAFRTIPTTSVTTSVNQPMPTTNHPPFNPFTIPTRPPTNLPNPFIIPATTTSTGTTSVTTANIYSVPWSVLPITTSVNTNITMPPVTSAVNVATSYNSNFQIPPTINTTAAPLTNPVLQPTTTVATSNTTTQAASNLVQQRILEAYLLDPYCRQGVKELQTSHNNQPSKDVPLPPPPTTTATTTINVVTTSTAALVPVPVVIPLQSNTRKTSSNSIVDLKLNLKPVPTATQSNSEATSTSVSGKSSLSSGFTQQEESILLNQNKTSRLRLPNDFLDSSPSDKPGLSLYPMRRLDELEKLTEQIQISNISIPTASPTVVKSETKDTTPEKTTKPMTSNVQSAQLPILTRDGYYIQPTMAELKSLCNNQGECIVHQVTIGHEKYGSVTFYGWINLSGMNLDEIVTIRHHEVIVYPDEDNKPPVGQGLNRSARVTLFGIYPIDRTTREEITDVDRIKGMNYEEYLSELTKKFDGQFVSYDAIDGAWIFLVKHFSRYGLDMEFPEDSSYFNNQ